ncbi:CYTH-like domain-containing protein [Staphylotrichum tortipilum]|uniref:CYTH-like domain-containing protein n=1 Tax=Staphylotrichum tortipilum TaxID=2831512 RepID=A0AAN6MMZ1_9PEZI|nr:CYTH-like domain-containing protein [Staphylotrichum longicolle]
MALRTTRALLAALPKPPSPTTPTKQPPALLEVERKFRRLTHPTLLHPPPAPSPPFHSVLVLPTRRIHDIYYDTPSRLLCAAGAWIRRRDGEWEAKLKRGGDFVKSRFEELRGEEEIARCIQGVLGAAGKGENFGLGKMAEFVTTREAWVVDGEFKVVRDRMDFGHEVGEVELEGEFWEGEGVEKGVVMEEMDRRVGEFMERYKWAWEVEGAVGKLTAYFEMVEGRRK